MTAEQQLKGFIDRFTPEHQRVIRGARRILRRRFPGAFELVYDNYNLFVIGYGPSERPGAAWFSIAAAANGVGFCFLHGARLPDPEKLLLGSGKQTRFIRLESAEVLERPAVIALIEATVANSAVKLPANARGSLVIRSISAKQRPRR